MDKVRLEDLISRVDEIPVFPQTIMNILTLTEDPESDVSEIVKEIMTDQGLTAKLLKLANTPFYGGTRKIKTVSEAAILLGYQVIKNMVIAAEVGKVLQNELPGYALEREALWRQSQICAIMARQIAKKTKYPKPDQVYTAGLLRDIGKVILDHYLNKQYEEITNRVSSGQCTFLEAEEEVLGYNHGQVGAKIAEKWNLPNDLVEAIALHHKPEMAVINPKMVAITHIADGLVMMLGVHLGVDGLAYRFSNEAIELLGLDEEKLDQIMADAVDYINDEKSYLTEL